MKLLLKQYLSSLKERDELDVVLPDILSEVGMTVISRPKRGTTQYGVDVAAIGNDAQTGEETLYLLSIKSGDLTRDEWATGKQALRPSLEEILEVYIPKHIPARYKDLPIIIALCFGGDIHEDVRVRVDGFIDKNTECGKIEFREWNGDFIANLIATGLLRENIFPKATQASFRKAVAMVDEPDISLKYFSELLRQLTQQPVKNKLERLRIARQIYLACWTVYVWARDVENLEAAYRASSYAALTIWAFSRDHFGNSKYARQLVGVVEKTITLSTSVAAAYIDVHVEPYAPVRDGLGMSVPSPASIDVNLKLFDLVGRVAISGLWLVKQRSNVDAAKDGELANELNRELERVSTLLCDIIETNAVLKTPIRDDHAIEINLACLFLRQCGHISFVKTWLSDITLASIFSHRRDGYYPCILSEYSELAIHPTHSDGYKQEVTVGSILYPTLGIWLAICGDDEVFAVLAEFQARDMQHSTWQLWVPDESSENHFYLPTEMHGSAIAQIELEGGPHQLLEQVNEEIAASTEFYSLSAVKYDYWPLLLMACHSFRIPVPIHFLAMDFQTA